MEDPQSQAPPHNLRAEEAVLGALLIDPAAYDKVEGKVEAHDFFKESHGLIYRACAALRGKGMQCDVVTVTHLLDSKGSLKKAGGVDYLSKLMEMVPTTVNVDSYAEIVAQKALQRAFLQEMRSAINTAYMPDHAEFQEALAKHITTLAGVQERATPSGAKRLKSALHEVWKRIEARQEEPGELFGIPTGLEKVDRVLGGLQPGRLYVVAARPSMGKSSLAMQCVVHAAEEGHHSGVFSIEMADTELAERSLASEAGIDSGRMLSGLLNENELRRLADAMGRLVPLPVWFEDDPEATIRQITIAARRLHREEGVRLFVVDYTQLVAATDARAARERQVAEVINGLKVSVARALHVPVLALAQLNRTVESRPDLRPNLGDLRESGAIEQAADTVMFLYPNLGRIEKGADWKTLQQLPIYLELAKNRQGKCGRCELVFNKPLTRIEEVVFVGKKTKARGDSHA